MQRAHPTARLLVSSYQLSQICPSKRILPPLPLYCPRQRLSTKREPPNHDQKDNPKKKRSTLRRLLDNKYQVINFAIAVALGWAYRDYERAKENRDRDKIFDAPRFTPFTITAREDVSPTSFILTLRPANLATNSPADPYQKEWESGIWSVEFKQPQLQIARSYTPLPPYEHTEHGDLRFLIRKEKGGEVSNYLATLPVGGQVELRGPHDGVDLQGDVKEVVFLAGGTGIAPALQVAHNLLERRQEGVDPPKVHIVWANRRREDCVGGGERAPLQSASTVVKELEGLQQSHPDHLRVEYLVDEEGRFVDQKKVLSLTRNDSRIKYGAVTTRIDSKLLFVSGPEGFVNFLAGPKIWKDGNETQGEVGGVIGRLGLKGWKVWKL